MVNPSEYVEAQGDRAERSDQKQSPAELFPSRFGELVGEQES